MAAPRVRVLVGRFEDLIAIGLRGLIAAEPSLELVGADVESAELDVELERERPDVAVLNLGSLPGTGWVSRLAAAHPATRIVLLANRPTQAEGSQLLAMGASVCLGKDTEARDVVNAIHLAARGMRLAPAMPGGRAATLGRPDLLTAREAEVLELLQRGLTNAQIGHALSVGVETVRTHARAIYRKLGVGSRRELARL